MDERTTEKPQASRFRIGELPDLRIADLDSLLLHEEPDERRWRRLRSRLDEERVLRNPPVVGETEDGVLVVLDGANRVTAAQSLGITHLPVQVVSLEDPSLEIKTWHHMVGRIDRDRFLRALEGEAGIRISESGARGGPFADGAPAEEPSDDPGALVNGHLFALSFLTGEKFVANHHANLTERLAALERVTGYYRTTPLFDRVSYTNLADLRRNYPGFTVLVSFQGIRKDEIAEVVRAGRRLPAGITRVVLPKRALGIDMDIGVLERASTFEEKHRTLCEMIEFKIAKKSVRFYEEPTFRFDE